MAMSRRAEELEEEEVGEINLVPYLDIVTNIVLFLLATISTGFLMGNINSALPEYAASAGAATAPGQQKEQPIQLVVSVTKPAILVWSVSGQEGTLDNPRAKIVATDEGKAYDFDKLKSVATEIVTSRNWIDTRPEGSTEVILMVDPEIRYEVVINAMDALRTGEEGLNLFPDVLFSTGIQ